LHDVAPFVLVFVRAALGGLILLPLALNRASIGALLRRPEALLLLAVIEVVLPFSLITGGEQTVPSSLTGILIATEPLAIAALALRFDPTERPSRSQLAGIILGLVGVAVLLGLGPLGPAGIAGALMILAAAVSYGAGALLIKLRFSDVPPISTAAGFLCLGAVFLLIPAAVQLPAAQLDWAGLAALLVLAGPCTALGFVLFFMLIARVGAGRASLITYLAPVVALALGTLAGHEAISGTTVIGLLLILGASRLATGKRTPAREAVLSDRA
jgi:drug/metabolite transporter (DMT)-like permease